MIVRLSMQVLMMRIQVRGVKRRPAGRGPPDDGAAG
jgi:hypothetical protein